MNPGRNQHIQEERAALLAQARREEHLLEEINLQALMDVQIFAVVELIDALQRMQEATNGNHVYPQRITEEDVTNGSAD